MLSLQVKFAALVCLSFPRPSSLNSCRSIEILCLTLFWVWRLEDEVDNNNWNLILEKIEKSTRLSDFLFILRGFFWDWVYCKFLEKLARRVFLLLTSHPAPFLSGDECSFLVLYSAETRNPWPWLSSLLPLTFSNVWRRRRNNRKRKKKNTTWRSIGIHSDGFFVDLFERVISSCVWRSSSPAPPAFAPNPQFCDLVSLASSLLPPVPH